MFEDLPALKQAAAEQKQEALDAKVEASKSIAGLRARAKEMKDKHDELSKKLKGDSLHQELEELEAKMKHQEQTVWVLSECVGPPQLHLASRRPQPRSCRLLPQPPHSTAEPRLPLRSGISSPKEPRPSLSPSPRSACTSSRASTRRRSPFCRSARPTTLRSTSPTERVARPRRWGERVSSRRASALARGDHNMMPACVRALETCVEPQQRTGGRGGVGLGKRAVGRCAAFAQAAVRLSRRPHVNMCVKSFATENILKNSLRASLARESPTDLETARCPPPELASVETNKLANSHEIMHCGDYWQPLQPHCSQIYVHAYNV